MARARRQRAGRDGLEGRHLAGAGSYFEADEADTPWVRFNVAYSEAPALWRFMRNAGAS